MFLKKLGKRGAEMVEYAIVLACIAAVGVGFYSSNDSKLTGVLDSLFGNVRQVLGLENNAGPIKFKVDDNAQKYADFIDKLINNLYAEMMKHTDETNPPKSVWIENDGTIKGFTDSKGNAIAMGINASTLLPEDCPYMPRANTRIFFDEKGNVINSGSNSVYDVSRIYLKNVSDSSQNNIEKNGNAYEAQITFNSATGTFGNGYQYWEN